MRGAVLAILVLGVAPAPAHAASVDAGALRGEVDDASGALRFAAGGDDVLAEAPAVRAGFRTPLGWFRATRAVRVARDGRAVTAELATGDPSGVPCACAWRATPRG